MAININGTGSITGLSSISAPGISGVPVGSASAPAFSFTGDTNTGIYSPGADQVAISTGGSGRLFVDASGNVGVNVASPGSFEPGARNLVVGSGAGNNGLSIYSGTADQGIIYFADGTTTAQKYTGFIAYDHSTNAMRFGTNDGNERLRIDSSGRLLVGTTTGATDGSVLLQVNGGISINGVTSSSAVNSAGHYISPVINSSGQNTCKSATNDTSGSGDLWQFSRINTDGVIFRFHRGTTSVGTISITGSATSYVTSSDYRLKKNIAPVTDGIVRLQQLKPSRFNFIVDPDKTVDGFLAHEVQTVVPEAITGEKDAVDDEGNPQYQGIDQSKLVPLLTAALQEAIGEIELLKSRLTAAGI